MLAIGADVSAIKDALIKLHGLKIASPGAQGRASVGVREPGEAFSEGTPDIPGQPQRIPSKDSAGNFADD